jgi:hypothetical protein
VAASVIDDAMIVSAAADLGLTAPAADRRWVARLALAVAFVLLVVAGAGAAAWVFRDEVSRLVTQWKGAPPPAAPVP